MKVLNPQNLREHKDWMAWPDGQLSRMLNDGTAGILFESEAEVEEVKRALKGLCTVSRPDGTVAVYSFGEELQ